MFKSVSAKVPPTPRPTVSRRELVEELYENNVARAEQMVWDTKAGKLLADPEINDLLLRIREAVWELDRELRVRR